MHACMRACVHHTRNKQTNVGHRHHQEIDCYGERQQEEEQTLAPFGTFPAPTPTGTWTKALPLQREAFFVERGRV